MTPPIPRDVVDGIESALAATHRLVAGVRHDQWNAPTPCTEWDVRTLVNHLVYEAKWAPDLFAGKTVEEVGDRYEGDQLGDDPVTTWRESSAAALAAITEPGTLD